MYRERVIFEKKGGEKEGRCTGEERLRRGTSTVGTATDRLKERKVRSKKTQISVNLALFMLLPGACFQKIHLAST
jgi:hypothetical protein